MSVPYYIGAKAIAERLGYKDTKIVVRLMEREALPVFKRRRVLKTGGFVTAWAISEAAVLAWELVQGQRYVNELRAKKALKLERQQGAFVA